MHSPLLPAQPAALALALAALLPLAGCRGNHLTGPHPLPDGSVVTCGNGVVDPGEQCDGTDLDGGTCAALGFNYGMLSCNAMCGYDTSQCVKCSDGGVLNPGAQCDGKLGDLTCSTWGYDVCTPMCTIDHSHCVGTAFRFGAPLLDATGGYTILAAIPPTVPASLVTATPGPPPQPAFLAVRSYNLNGGFLSPRVLSSISPLYPIAADVNGDGQLDLAGINEDGSVERHVYNGGGFTDTISYSGSACPAATWVGAGHVADAGGPSDLIALACGGAVLVLPGGVPAPAAWFALDGGLAAATGDVNGDGLTDVLLITDAGASWLVATPSGFTPGPLTPLPLSPLLVATTDFEGDGGVDVVAADGVSVQVLHAADGGYVSRLSYPAAANALLVQDLGLDGRPDFAWVDAAGIHVRRNQGGFTFGLFDFAFDAGVPISLSAGDIDGNGDPDLAATYSLGGGQTLTQPLLGQVQ